MASGASHTPSLRRSRRVDGVRAVPYPTEGPIIREFGERLENGTYSQGIFVQAGGGAYVVAPREGQIVFSGHFRTYGRLLIIEHAGGYHSLLAGFSTLVF